MDPQTGVTNLRGFLNSLNKSEFIFYSPGGADHRDMGGADGDATVRRLPVYRLPSPPQAEGAVARPRVRSRGERASTDRHAG